MAVGAEGDVALLGQEDLARLAVDGRHLPLDEEPDVVQAEVAVLLEEPGGGLVVLGAGHDVERDRPAVAAGEGDDLLGVDLEQAGGRDRADRVGPLRAVEPEPGARAARDDHHGDLAGGQGRLADRGDVAAGDPLAVGPGEAVDLDRRDPVGRRRPRPP